MNIALFLRLVEEDNQEKKEGALSQAISSLRKGAKTSFIYIVDTCSFKEIPGSPFAYWISNQIRRIFSQYPSFTNESERLAIKGLTTSDDFRFVRLWWEIDPEQNVTNSRGNSPNDIRKQTLEGKTWVAFARGGKSSPYYAEIDSVVNWQYDGKEMKMWVSSLYEGTSWSRNIRSVNYYFYPGLTWTLRAAKFSPAALPAGCIFSARGHIIISSSSEDLLSLLGLGNSSIFDFLFKVLLGRFEFPEFIIASLQKVPCPNPASLHNSGLSELAFSCINLKREIDTANENSRVFILPTALQGMGNTLKEIHSAWQLGVREIQQEIADYQSQMHKISCQLYGIDDPIEQEVLTAPIYGQESFEETVEEDFFLMAQSLPILTLVQDLVSYSFGCALGRWDVRFAIGILPKPELCNPFDPISAYSPSMINPGTRLDNYPITIDQNGIFADDSHNPNDVVHHIRNVLEAIWKDKLEAVESEACEILDVKDLRDYFRRSGKGGFWDDHIKRYSKSRRKAPIYWLLQSSKRSYALWIYYHRLDKDTLFKAQNQYVEPKLTLEQSNLDQLRRKREGLSGSDLKKLEREIDKQENFVAELQDFLDKLKRAANLHLEPDLNDGVVLNIAPLWELVPWGEAKKYWQELAQGKYEWSSIGKQLRARGLIS